MYSLRFLLLRTDDKKAARGTQTDNAYYYALQAQDTTHRTFLTKDIDKFSCAVVIGLILIMLIIGTYMNHNDDLYSAYAHTSVDGTVTTNDKRPMWYEGNVNTALAQVMTQISRQNAVASAVTVRTQEQVDEFPPQPIQVQTILQPSVPTTNIVLSDISDVPALPSERVEIEKIQVENNPALVQTTVDPSPSVIVTDNKQYTVKDRMVVPMTAYSSTVDQTDSTPFITASNKRVRWGIVAANFLPFGTKVRIPSMYGDMVFTVEDRMNKRYWHRVDIWMHTRQEALQFGVRTLELEILQEV